LKKHPIVIAIDGTSASGKSTNAKLVARALATFMWTPARCIARWRGIACKSAWTCMTPKPSPPRAANGKPKLECVEKDGLRVVRLLVDGYFPEKEIRLPETAAAVPHVAAVPKAREWMVKRQRECIEFGNLVMEGRDIGTNVFPETDFKFYLDAHAGRAHRAPRRRRRE
jgi:cytidylate kinase